ncbi:hypothetical protein [Streptomyces albidoflavus]|uniref:hypothetical protein n=1 Tax=Streptomyces albidoflavus TaxID=1886 RepID=UPI0005271580|nr:hypothetical protein [Streptomyces albidoflavus]WTC05736.1 hypothetical protein OG794_29735 [Streptomyces albidoflavus]WTC06218.1 hypothetical protein OG794_30690 [Streptomyces albidoflavus]
MQASPQSVVVDAELLDDSDGGLQLRGQIALLTAKAAVVVLGASLPTRSGRQWRLGLRHDSAAVGNGQSPGASVHGEEVADRVAAPDQIGMPERREQRLSAEPAIEAVGLGREGAGVFAGYCNVSTLQGAAVDRYRERAAAF